MSLFSRLCPWWRGAYARELDDLATCPLPDLGLPDHSEPPTLYPAEGPEEPADYDEDRT